MRYYILLAITLALLALAMPYLGVRTRDGELTVLAKPGGTLIASTPTYERLPPTPYEINSDCEFPRLDKDATLVLLSAYDTQSVSTTALADEKEIAVGAGTLTIEDGDTPIYIVLITFDATIWQVKGAVERISYLVLGSQETNATIQTLNQHHTEQLVGATGVEANKVHFLPNKCMHYFKNREEAKLAGEAVEHYLGRKPDVVAGAEHVNGFSAPSGAIEQISAGRSPLQVFGRRMMELLGLRARLNPAEEYLQNDMDLFTPGGVMQVDAKSVVSQQPASPYRVLPAEAGMLQLLHQGDISPGDQDGESFRIGQGVFKNYNFVINRPIQFPAGLYGGHLRHFILAPGVPLPTGNVGHSCVKSQTTGQILLSDGMC